MPSSSLAVNPVMRQSEGFTLVCTPFVSKTAKPSCIKLMSFSANSLLSLRSLSARSCRTILSSSSLLIFLSALLLASTSFSSSACHCWTRLSIELNTVARAPTSSFVVGNARAVKSPASTARAVLLSLMMGSDIRAAFNAVRPSASSKPPNATMRE